MTLIQDLIESYHDWRYGQLARKHRALIRGIEMRQHARNTTIINDDNKAEAFVAFLDRRIDVLAKRRDKVAVKLGRIYDSWKA